MARHANLNWTLPDKLQEWGQVNAALLMDIRDELRKLNAVLACQNFQDIPRILRRVSVNTAKPRKAKN